MFLLALLTSPFAQSAEPESHLAQLARQHGWQTVAAVVSSANQGDLTLSDVHVRLKELGLGDLNMPTNGSGPGVPSGSTLTECGWNQGVFCQLDVPPGTAPVLTPTCANAAGPVGDITLTAVYGQDPTPDAGGRAHIGDLLPCWSAGGDRVVLTAGVPKSETDLAMTVEGQPAAVVQHRLAPYAPGIRSCAPGEVHIETDALGRLTILKMHRDGVLDPTATSCIQDVLTHLRLDGAASVRVDLHPPAP